MRGAWTLTPAAGGDPISGVETVTTTYAAADQPYAAIAAQQDGEERTDASRGRADVDHQALRSRRVSRGRRLSAGAMPR